MIFFWSFAHFDRCLIEVIGQLTMSQMSEWLFWPNAKQMQTESLSLCLKKRNELSQWRESPQQSLECFKVHYIHGKRSCLDMKLTLAAGKLSTSAGVVQYKEPVVCGDLTPPTQTASETNSPAALRTVASKTCQVDSKQLLQLFEVNSTQCCAINICRFP